MPLYDCGAPECEECQRAFKDRARAIAAYEKRARQYATITNPPTLSSLVSSDYGRGK